MMNYCYGKGVHKSVLCWEVVLFVEAPLSEVVEYAEVCSLRRCNSMSGCCVCLPFTICTHT